MKNVLRIAALCIGLAAGSSITAHHSFSATFDAGNKITVRGTVTRYSFRNPHVLIYFEVENNDGTVTEWMGEGASATNLRRGGWSNDTFQIGDIVQITGDRTHDGSPMTSIDAVQVLSPTGEILREPHEVTEEQGYVKAAPMSLTLADGRPNLGGAWTRHGMGLGRPPGAQVSFTETGQAAQSLFTQATDPQVFCDAPGLVRQAGMTPHPVRITQLDDRVIFEYEEYAGYREIFFDERNFLGYKTHLGDSIARYEGDALIIESRNLLSNPSSPGGQVLSDQTSTTEVYTRVDSETFGPVIRIQMIAKDPAWVDGELIFDNIKMSAGEYEFIENDCRPPLRERVAVNPFTSFFLTSRGLGDGANLGGLEGADAHCENLATELNIGGKDWRAYLSTTGENAVNARDRIGPGPWYNSRGVPIATGVDDLHRESNNITKLTALAENSSVISGRDDEVNRHDVLTGSRLDGTAFAGDADTTCNNWTSNGEGSAIVGHFDRVGGGDNPESWNQSHASRGCSQEDLQATGGDGLFYCFASIENTTEVTIGSLSVAINSAPAGAISPEQALAASTANVPESRDGPSSLGIAGVVLVLLALGGFTLRRKAKSGHSG